MNLIAATYGPWALVGSLVTLIVTGFYRKWVVPYSVLQMLVAYQKQITEMRAEEARLERERAEVYRQDLVKLTEALKQSLPGGEA